VPLLSGRDERDGDLTMMITGYSGPPRMEGLRPACTPSTALADRGGDDDRGAGIAAQAPDLRRVRTREQLDRSLGSGLEPHRPGLRVSVAGRTTVEPDGAHDLCVRLAARYWDLDDPALADDLAEILATDQVRLVIHPETVSHYAY
jgi:hypothetical protein